MFGNKGSITHFREQLTSLLREVNAHIVKGFSKEAIVEKVTFEDTIHCQYPPHALKKFANTVKMSIGRLYDELRRYEAEGRMADINRVLGAR